MTEPRPLINSFDQITAAGGRRFVISYHAREVALAARWVVLGYQDGREFVTDPKAAWFDHGRKTFLPDPSSSKDWRDAKQKAYDEAVAWVKRRYNAVDFVRNTVGDYVERDVNERFPIPRQKKNGRAPL